MLPRSNPRCSAANAAIGRADTVCLPQTLALTNSRIEPWQNDARRPARNVPASPRLGRRATRFRCPSWSIVWQSSAVSSPSAADVLRASCLKYSTEYFSRSTLKPLTNRPKETVTWQSDGKRLARNAARSEPRAAQRPRLPAQSNYSSPRKTPAERVKGNKANVIH